MNEPAKVPLSPTEAAFVAMVLEEHAALVRNADANRERRMKVLLDEKGVPAGLPVQNAVADGVMSLIYTPPEMAVVA